ncbi:MAG: glycosyltransferase [Pseudomonadota bacterium]|nr:glycosyltransferase [Pseudomonadota bacterium]
MKKTLLIIGYVWPEPNSSAAGTRMMQLIKLFQAKDWQITFASPSKLGDHRLDLTQLGITEQNIELNNQSFDDFLAKLQPNAVMFDRFMMEEQFSWRVEKYAPDAVRILNTEDLHSLREARQQQLKALQKQENASLEVLWNQSSTNLFNLMAKLDLAQREIASILRCDLTLMISKFETELLQKAFKIDPALLMTLPFVYQEVKSPLPNFDQRQHFVFIGNFRHAPNWDSVLWLKENIWPEIRKQVPLAELHIYGAYPAKKVTNLHNPKQGFIVKGWAEDAFKVISNARLLLAPLRFGAGIKGKLAEAMLCGTPSITTPVGSEAMLPESSSNLDWPGYIGETEKNLIKHAVELYQDSKLWNQAQQQGLELGNQQYQQTQLSEEFIEKLSDIQNNLERHRQQNFMGSMLRHHHHKSTQYMAQWIEAKNRKLD